MHILTCGIIRPLHQIDMEFPIHMLNHCLLTSGKCLVWQSAFEHQQSPGPLSYFSKLCISSYLDYVTSLHWVAPYPPSSLILDFLIYVTRIMLSTYISGMARTIIISDEQQGTSNLLMVHQITNQVLRWHPILQEVLWHPWLAQWLKFW